MTLAARIDMSSGASSFRFAAIAVLAAVALVGCADLEPPPERSAGATRISGDVEGRVTVAWTIEGNHDVAACNVYDAVGIQIVVLDLQGAERGAFEDGCSSFSTSVPLDPGSYVVRAALVDRFERDRTTVVTSEPFDVGVLGATRVAIDFPVRSFFRQEAGRGQQKTQLGGPQSR